MTGAVDEERGEAAGPSTPSTRSQERRRPLRTRPGRSSVVYRVQTHLSEPERLLLFGLVRGLRPAHVLDIGTFHGASAAIIAAALEDNGAGTLVGVDPMNAVERGSPVDVRSWCVHNFGTFSRNEHATEVNGSPISIMTDNPLTPADEELLTSALGRLAEAELHAVVEGERGAADADFDALVRVGAPVGTELYGVQLKTKVSPGSAAAIHPKGDRRLLVVSPYVSDSVAEVWRSRDIHYVDSAGNMYLRWPGLLVDVRGRRRPSTPQPSQVGRPLRAFKSSGLRILFALLSDPGIVSAPYRDIGHHSGASLGTVQWVFKELERAGYVHSGPDGRRLHRVRDLFSRWVEAYALDLWPRLTLGHFESPDPMWWTKADEAMRAEGAQWGGETAAHRMNSHLRPGKAVVYASTLPRRLIIGHRLRKSGVDGNVEIRERFWNFPQPSSQLTVPTPLIYADLVASADPRQLEAAAYLRDHDDLLRRLDSD